ncbi:MAG: hypothetical protein WCB71_03095 [Aestuariivirga sp.]
MTVPIKYANSYVPVKYFLASYRALSDGRTGIHRLEKLLDTKSVLLSEWKVIWIGTCTVLRTAIDLFKIDKKSCIAPRIREEIAAEWKVIQGKGNEHAIFWEFLLKERDNVIHQYQWRAYETWIRPDGTFRATRLSLLTMGDDGARPVLMIRGGPFDGRDSLDLLKEGADWVEARIFNSIRRAGFDPEEHRGLAHFQSRPTLRGGLLGDPIQQ